MVKITYGSAIGVLGLAMGATLPVRADSLLATDLPSIEGAAAASASSGTELEPIVVTAQRLRLLLREENKALDLSRDQNLMPKLGASTYNIGQEAIQAMPQGKNTPLDKVLLQAPGVSYDSAISNPDFHVRNEYANVQYRINGIQLPDGVSALGSVLETGFIGNLNLLDGALPAQYGLRTAGVIDMTTKSTFDPGGNVDLYAGSWGTVSPSIEYGGSEGRTQYRPLRRQLGNGQPQHRVRRQRGSDAVLSDRSLPRERSGSGERHA